MIADVSYCVVKPGQVVQAHGYKWRVKENVFDPRGNTGTQRRHILVCDAVEPGILPVTYRINMTLGGLCCGECEASKEFIK